MALTNTNAEGVGGGDRFEEGGGNLVYHYSTNKNK